MRRPVLPASRLIATGLVVAMGTACNGGRAERPVMTTAAQETAVTSLVRVVNALPSRPRIDVAGGGRRIFTGVAYRGVTPYARVSGTAVTFRVRATGTDGPLADHRARMTEGERYTIVAFPLDYVNVRLHLVRDEPATDPSKARIRMFNAAPAVQHAAVVILGRRDALFADLVYAAEAGFRDIDPTTATIEIRRDTGFGRTIQLRDLRFEAGTAYTIILTGSRPTEVETVMFDDGVAGGPPIVAVGAQR